jgi:hypothetical protein
MGGMKRKRKRGNTVEDYKRRVWTHLCKISAKELINL